MPPQRRRDQDAPPRTCAGVEELGDFMNMPNDKRFLTAFGACLFLYLPACERVLDVVDEIEPPGSEPSASGGSASGIGGAPSSEETVCACTRSPGLLPLSCGLDPVPLLDNDVVQ